METTPYTAKILELSTKLAGLQDQPVPPMFSPEEIERRKAEQQRAEQLAVLAKLSGDKGLGAVGATLLPEALKLSSPRYTEHGEFDPLSGRHSVFPEYTRRRAEERTARELQGMELKDLSARQATESANRQREFLTPYKDATKAAQDAATSLKAAQEELARQKLRDAQRKASEGKTLTGQVYKDVKQLGDDARALDLVKEKFVNNFVAGTSGGLSFVGDLQDTLSRAAPSFVPDQWVKNRDAWADLQRMKEMKARYALFGATLTGNEKTSWQSVTPPRGLDADQLGQWFTDQELLLKKAIRSTADAAAKGGWNKAQIEEYTNKVWKAPKEGAGLSDEQRTELEALEKELGLGR